MTDQHTPAVVAGDGTRLHVQDWGSGPPVVLLATAMLDSRQWEHQAGPLAAAGLRTVAVDRRGCGRSDRPWDGYDFDTLADDLAAVLDALDLRDVTLVGYAMGGGEAVRYLTRHGSHRVGRLVLAASTTPFLSQADDNPHGLTPADYEPVLAAMRADRARFLAELTVPFFGGPAADADSVPVSAELRAHYARMALDTSPHAAEALYRALLTEDFRAELPKVDVPALVVHGDADVGSPFALCGPPTAELLPDARLEVYEGAAHGLFVTHAERLTRDLREFVRS
ncbi:alpha/beta hydrolase [Streptomyces durbertensis]|uniref:Alpha/beta hydrolase n=1 Tax=Streptomyces durbertensis TaxID=2448886 RepID=A0ABR6EGR5_9ACTN|nr:alpha/beta hydrolase [Streptomyces durbertensis]MBB1244478.1 alpha/beta hydrolase [Streptomyces durbertensis]